VTIPWQQLQLQLDAVIDDQWSEQVLLVPMDQTPYSEGNQPDLTRRPKPCRGVLTMNGDRSFPLLGDHSGAPFQGRVNVFDITFSIQDSELAGFDLRVGDNIKFLERNNLVLEVNRPDESATGRNRYFMIDNNQ
jgi:hypothetical protein